VEFGVLGPLQVRCGDAIVDLRRGPRNALIYLLLHAGDTVRSDVLIDALWADDQPANPANALQTQISYLRRQLATYSPTQPIVTRPGGYAIEIDPDAVDAHRFGRVVQDAATAAARGDADPSAVVTAMDEALSWWRGDALEDVAGEPFAIGDAARLEELRLTAIELRHDAALALGRHHEVAGDLAALVQAHPLRERLHSQLMVALYRSGRQADALRAFTVARQHLVGELGIEPGPELRDLERRILDHDPTLMLPAAERPAPAGHPAAPPSAPGVSRPGRRHATSATLPAAVTPLIGREVELERVARLLDRSRAVTLTGPAGAGKSRLAIEAARVLSATQAVWYVDLGNVDDPTQVSATVANALDVPTVPGDDPVESVSAALESRTGVLLLDTCEHVVGAVASLVGRVLREAPDVRVLATSRRPLNVTGEIAWPVPPLALAGPGTALDDLRDFPSIQLFIERAQAVQPDFELTARDADDVAAICMALDGLPLAIELAAARTDVLPPRLIRERLARRFDLLVGGGSDASARQQTLRGAIDWSIDLLAERERTAFARLGALVGTFDLDAAGCVTAIDDPDELLAVITLLVRHSLVVRTQDARLRLLDTLRAYALELLQDLDADATRTRHARCYVSVAESTEIGIRGPDQLDWLTRARDDLANHRAALEWMISTGDSEGAARLAGALGWFWTLDGLLTEACTQLEAVLEFPDLPPRARAKVAWSLALVVASLGDLGRAAELACEAITHARDADAPIEAGYGLNALAVSQWGLGELDAAESSRDEAIAIFDEHDEIWGAGVSRVLRGRSALDRDDPHASTVVHEGLRAAEATGDRHLIGMAREQLARLALCDGDIHAALEHADEAVRHHDEIGYTEGALAARHVLGLAHFDAGDLDAALREHLCALAAARTIGHRAAMCEALDGIALVHHATGSPADAIGIVTTSTLERDRLGVPRRPDDVARLATTVSTISAPEVGRVDAFDEVVDRLVSRT
jgi:predicted ATPase/DNA-binding SARP family transcriptional activator